MRIFLQFAAASLSPIAPALEKVLKSRQMIRSAPSIFFDAWARSSSA